MAGAAYADTAWQDSVNVQFTFDSSLSMVLSGGDTDGNATISLDPGIAAKSDDITIAVTTNGGAGYTLSAKVGVSGGDYANNNLVGAGGVFSSLASDASVSGVSNITADYWGYSLDGGTTFSGLIYNTDKVLRATNSSSGTANTTFAIGAKASASKASGTYSNTITFNAVSNVTPVTVTTVAGENATSAIIGTSGSTTSGTYSPGDSLTVKTTCDTGYVFGGWTLSGDYGFLAAPNSAQTTFTTGLEDVTLTGWCVEE